MQKQFLIYGATGYTGKLITEMAKKQGFSPLLGGRNPQKLKQLSETLDLEYRAVALDNKSALRHEVAYFDCSAKALSLRLNPASRRCDPMEACAQGASLTGMKPS